MDSFITQILKKLEKDGVVTTIKAIYRKFKNEINKAISKLGNKRCCYICGKKFNSFNKFRNGSKGINEFRKKLNGVGSDADNFGCIYCGSNDRERHLFMFFDKLMLWDSIENKRILHFAPEKHLQVKISEQNPVEYIKADLNPAREGILKINATSVPYGDDTFDFLIANHILEHIPTYKKALSEFYRVIKPGGFAILQTWGV
jgi:SAM-dependent methyltransferase